MLKPIHSITHTTVRVPTATLVHRKVDFHHSGICSRLEPCPRVTFCQKVTHAPPKKYSISELRRSYGSSRSIKRSEKNISLPSETFPGPPGQPYAHGYMSNFFFALFTLPPCTNFKNLLCTFKIRKMRFFHDFKNILCFSLFGRSSF